MHCNENGNNSYSPISGTTFNCDCGSNDVNKTNEFSVSMHSSTDDQQSSSYQSGSGNIEHQQLFHNNAQRQHQRNQQQQQHQSQQQQQQSQSQLNNHHLYRYGHFSRHNTMASLAAIGDSMSEILSDDVQNAAEPTSMILSYCKRKFLRPYVIILSLVGLQPLPTDTTCFRSFLSHFQAILILFVLTCGYIVQYMSLFRGDRGFGTQRSLSLPNHGIEYIAPNTGEIIFGYIIPSALHLAGYLSAIIVFKIANNEHLQNLVERVFLMATHPKRLCFILWVYIAIGFLWMIILLAFVIVLASTETKIIEIDLFGRFDENMQFKAKILLVVCLFIYDFVQILVLMIYCIECLLLRFHLITLSQKFVQHTIESIDWMREILEFRKLLNHLNNRIAIPVCFFTMMNLSYAFAGLVYLFKDFDFHYSPLNLVVLNVINVTIWCCMGLLPFFQAASLTRVCYSTRANGHQIRVRPFVYHNTSVEDLNSTLLFASSLNMSAKLFRMPIQVNYLFFAILVVSIFILTVGMCLNLQWEESI